jgi:hypothetical protein
MADTTGVDKTIDSGTFVIRRRNCHQCTAAWSTTERLIKGTLVATGDPDSGPSDPENGGDPQPLVATGGFPQANLPSVFLSDPNPSSFPLDPDFSPGLEASDSGARTREPRRGRRGKNKPTTPDFEAVWKLYGRKEDKAEAFEVWGPIAMDFGGEPKLRVAIEGALIWQAPNWAKEGWKYAPYFCRYLRRRKWEDAPPPPALNGVARPGSRGAALNVDHGLEWLSKRGGEG